MKSLLLQTTLIMGLLGILPGGCADSSGPSQQIEPFPSTHVLDDASLAAITSQASDGTLTFSGIPDQLADLDRFQVLVAGPGAHTPHGLMHLVTEVDTSTGNLVVSTMPAPIQLAFRKVHVKFSGKASRDVLATGQPIRSSGALRAADGDWLSKEVDEYAFDGDGDPNTPDDQVHVTGHLQAGFEYTLGVDTDWGDVLELPSKVADCLGNLLTGSGCSVRDMLPEVTVGFQVQAGAEADLALAGVSFYDYHQEFEFEPIPLDPFQIGGILWFFPSIQVTASIDGEAASQFSLATSASAGFGTGISYSSQSGGSYQPPNPTYDFQAPEVSPTLSARARVSVGPRLVMKLYNLVGPYAGLYVFAELDADRDRTPCYRLNGGLEGELGFVVAADLAGLGKVTLAEWDSGTFELLNQEIGSGACSGSAGPGTGPGTFPGDLQDPDFTPWSNRFAGLIFSHPFEGPGAQLEWGSLTRHIDGRYVFAGSEANALFKFGEDGEPVWARHFEGPTWWTDTLKPDILINRVINTEDGGMLVLGHPYVVLKVDAAGRPIWNRQLEVPYRQSWLRLTDGFQAADGDFILVGTHGDDPSEPRDADAWVVKMDESGKVVWSRLLGDSNAGEMARRVVPLHDGFVVAGSTWVPAAVQFTGFIARFSNAGELVWAEQLQAADCQQPTDTHSLHLLTGLATPDDDIILGGSIESSRYESALVKIKPDGSLGWFQASQSDPNDIGVIATDVLALPTSGYLACGTFIASNAEHDVWLAGLDSIGRFQWGRRFGRDDPVQPDDDSYPALALAEGGGVLVASYAADADGPGLQVMKVPARDGAIDFSATSGIQTSALDLSDSANCLTLQSFNVTARELSVSTIELDITSNPVNLTTRPLTD